MFFSIIFEFKFFEFKLKIKFLSKWTRYIRFQASRRNSFAAKQKSSDDLEPRWYGRAVLGQGHSKGCRCLLLHSDERGWMRRDIDTGRHYWRWIAKWWGVRRWSANFDSHIDAGHTVSSIYNIHLSWRLFFILSFKIKY